MTQRDKSIQFIEEICKLTSLTYSALASKAGVSPSTLNRFVRDDTITELSIGTRDKVAKVAGYDSYEDYILKNEKKGVNIALLKECIHALEEEAKIQRKTFSTDQMIDLAVKLYEIVAEDRQRGINTISPGAVKTIIKG